MSSFCDKLKGLDFFGHPVRLKFNKKGSEHATLFGGVVSLFLLLGLLAYFVILVKKLVLYEDD